MLFNSNITGNGNVGSIVGGADNARVVDCAVNTDVILKGNGNVGGIAGILENGAKILGCKSSRWATPMTDKPSRNCGREIRW